MMRRSLNNRPLRSVLANRKLFQGGGMVGTGNPMAMANMQPAGILASSPNLINAVANDAINPQGGPTLSMADGGIAKFHEGGSVHRHPHTVGSYQVPALAFEGYEKPPPSPPLTWDNFLDQIVAGELQPSGERAYNPIPTREGYVTKQGHQNIPISQIELESPASRVDRMFPDAAGAGGMTHEDKRGHLGSIIPGKAGRLLAEGVSAAESIVGGSLEGLLIDAGSFIDAGFSDEMDPESESYIENFGIGERTTLAHLVARAPEWLKPQILEIGKGLISKKDYDLPDLGAENMRATEADADGWVYSEDGSPVSKAGRGGLAYNPLAQDIAQALYEKYDAPRIDRTKQIVQEQERVQGRQVPGYPFPPATAAEEMELGEHPEGAFGPHGDLRTTMMPKHLEMLRNAASGDIDVPLGQTNEQVRDSEVAKIIRGLQESGLPSSYTDELLRVFQAEDEDLIEADQEVAVAAEAAAAAAEGMYPEQYPGSDALLTADTAETAVAAGEEIPLPVTKPTPGEVTAADDLDRIDYLGAGDPIRNIESAADQVRAEYREADTPEKQGEAQTSLEAYLEEFRKAVPDYEGKSEWEKGMDIVKMGMAIAAGESPHAITNIAKGVMATIDNFTSDDKERRAYERQVALSAGKYALDSVERDRTRRDALLKEGRVITQAIAAEDFVDPQGKEIKRGQAYPVTRTQIDEGIFQDLPLTYTNVFIENARSIKAYEAAQATATARLREENIIGYKEADTINKRLRGAREDFVHSEAGEALLSGVVEQLVLNPNDITGAEGAAKKLWGDVLNVIGKGEEKSRVYKNRELLEVDMKMAFQKLIPVALRNIQAGNSISDRDVRNLANAYIAGGFIDQNADGTFTINTVLAGKNPEVLVRQLQQTIKIFRDSQQNSLITFEQELYNLSQAEPGRHDIRYFEPELKRMAPAIEAYRGAREGQTRGETSAATRMKAPSVLQVSDYFDLATGKSIKPIPRWEEEG
jgi:hypothetical protein